MTRYLKNDDDSLEIYNLSLVEFSKGREDYYSIFWSLKRCKNKNPICVGVEDFKLLVIQFVPVSLTYIYDSYLLNIASTGE